MKLGRDFRTVSVGLTSTQLLGGNFRRYGIIVSSPLQNRITLQFGGAAVLDQGVTINPGTLPLILMEHQIGYAIKEDIFAIAAIAAQQIGIQDIFWS